MTPELKPCPFCGGWKVGTAFGIAGCHECKAQIQTEHNDIATAAWNRRTPDPTEALARLKALEERLRMGCGPGRHQTVLSIPDDYTGYIPHGCSCSMADEIAAIRNKLEGK